MIYTTQLYIHKLDPLVPPFFLGHRLRGWIESVILSKARSGNANLCWLSGGSESIASRIHAAFLWSQKSEHALSIISTRGIRARSWWIICVTFILCAWITECIMIQLAFRSQDFCDQMEQELKPLPERIWYGLVLKRIGDPTSFPVRKCKKAFGCLWTCFCRPEENVFEKLWTYVEQSSAELTAPHRSFSMSGVLTVRQFVQQQGPDQCWHVVRERRKRRALMDSPTESRCGFLTLQEERYKNHKSIQIRHEWVENPDRNDVMMLHTVYNVCNIYIYIHMHISLCVHMSIDWCRFLAMCEAWGWQHRVQYHRQHQQGGHLHPKL
jgi:hypothetical protein